MDFREVTGLEWGGMEVNAATSYVLACNVARTSAHAFIEEKDLRELPRRFEAAARIYAGSREFPDALRIAIEKLRRGFHPARCNFEDWFAYNSILGKLSGFRPDYLDSPGKEWVHAQRFDAAKYAFSRLGNLRLYLELIHSRIRLSYGAEGSARLDRFFRLQQDPWGTIKDIDIFKYFDPAKCCFEYWVLLCLLDWILPGARSEKKL